MGALSFLSLASFQRYRRWNLGSPRCSALPVAPFDEFRVTPDPASSGSVGDGSSSCPESRILSALPAVKLRVSPKPHCTRCASRCIPGLPRLLHLPTLPAIDLRVAPNLTSFSASGASTTSCPAASLFRVAPVDEFPRSPRFPHLPAVPATDLRVTPNLSSFGASVA